MKLPEERSLLPLRQVLVLLLVAATCSALAQHSTPAGQRHELVVAEIVRTYQIHLPPPDAGDSPLLLVLHGRGGSGAGMASVTGFAEWASDAPMVVVYPDGMEGQWNYLTGLGGNQGVDDVRFIHELVAEIVGRHPVDLDRVFIAGYSNGGFMVQRLACESDSPFAAFATVAAAGFGGLPELCDQPRPLSLMHVHGTADRVVPWSGQTAVIGGREILLSAPVPQTFAFWANFAGCGGASDRRSIALAGSLAESVEVLRVSDCPAGSEVALYAVVGGGHAWPRIATAGAAGGSGFDVSNELLRFFGVEPDAAVNAD